MNGIRDGYLNQILPSNQLEK